jgi:hypothetical protein
MRPDNSIHLATAAQKRHENTRIKAIAALHDLDQAGAPINFAAVAEHAGFSELRMPLRPLCFRVLCVGQTEVDSGWGRAPVDLGEFVVGSGEADLESFDFAEPAFVFGFGDAGD